MLKRRLPQHRFWERSGCAEGPRLSQRTILTRRRSSKIGRRSGGVPTCGPRRASCSRAHPRPVCGLTAIGPRAAATRGTGHLEIAAACVQQSVPSDRPATALLPSRSRRRRRSRARSPSWSGADHQARRLVPWRGQEPCSSLDALLLNLGLEQAIGGDAAALARRPTRRCREHELRRSKCFAK